MFYSVKCNECNKEFFSFYEPVIIETIELHMMQTGHVIDYNQVN